MTFVLSAPTAGRRSPYLSSSAEFSPDLVYRYALTRQLSPAGPALLFIGLNPSTADAEADDPTIRRCVGFARDWDFAWLLMGNLHGFRSTDPNGLPKDGREAVGPGNRATLFGLVGRADLVIAAWGGQVRLSREAASLAHDVLRFPHVMCLGQNADGSPKHPLYLKKSLKPVPVEV